MVLRCRHSSMGSAMSDADRADFLAMLTDYGLAQYAHKLRQGAEHSAGKLDVAGFPVAVRESPVEGLGTFATEPLLQGRFIFPASLHGHRTRPGWHVNHGAAPNVRSIVGPEGDLYEGVWFLALRDIAAGEELLADYRQTVALMLATAAGCAPAALTREQIRSALLRLWVQHKCPL